MVAEKIVDSLSHIRQLEEMAKKKSVIHQRDHRIKVLTTIVYIIAVASVPITAQAHLIRLAIYPVMLWSLSQLPIKPLWNRVVLVFPFILCLALGTLLTDLTPMTVAGFSFTRGMVLAIHLCLKSVLSLFGVLYLLATTPLTAVMQALTALQAPKIFVSQLNFIIRYLTVLMEEAANIVRAYVLRSGNALDGISYKQWGGLLGNLFLRTYDRANRIQHAMVLRQNLQNSTIQTQMVAEKHPISLLDYCYLIAWTTFFLLSYLKQ